MINILDYHNAEDYCIQGTTEILLHVRNGNKLQYNIVRRSLSQFASQLVKLQFFLKYNIFVFVPHTSSINTPINLYKYSKFKKKLGWFAATQALNNDYLNKFPEIIHLEYTYP